MTIKQNYIRKFIKIPIIFSLSIKNSEAYKILAEVKEECAVVIDEESVKGLVMKEKLFRILGSAYGHSLYANKPVTKIMDTAPLNVDISMPVGEMMKLSLERDEDNKYDSILVNDNGSLIGFITVKDLLLISSAMQHDKIVDQISNMVHSRELMEHIKRNTEKVMASGILGKESADEMLDLTFRGREHIERIHNATHGLLGITEKQVEQIQNLKGYAELVKGFINIIENLSDRINLLALNASIEAARAGEYGRGFNVVAMEIRKLANEAKGSSLEIGDSITKMVNVVEQTASMVLDGRNEFENYSNMAGEMNDLFNLLFESISKTKENVSVIFENTREASEEASMAVESIDDIISRLQTHIEAHT